MTRAGIRAAVRARRSLAVAACTAATLVGGYADLIRGGIDLSAALLVAAYVGAIPAAILVVGRRAE